MSKGLILIICSIIAIVVVVASFVAVGNVPEPPKVVDAVQKDELTFSRGKLYLESGEEGKAINAFEILLEEYPNSTYVEKTLKELITYYSAKGNEESASEYYEKLVTQFPKTKGRRKIRSLVEKSKVDDLFSTEISDGSVEYVVKPGDSLYKIAKKHKTTIALIKKINNLKGDVIHPRQKLKVNTASFSIFVDKSENILKLYRDGKLFKTYIVATGKNNSTPVGEFTIVGKEPKPVWTKPGVGMIMPDSEEYELGERWIAISVKGYGIHGTNDENSIGGQVTSGCVRMYNDDVIELYDLVTKGTKVKIVD